MCIAIAWRADTDNEFCTNVVETFRQAGITVIEAVERTDKHCAIGLQFHPEAAIVKRTGKHINNANADEFMTYNEAMHIFKTFISKCKSNLPR